MATARVPLLDLTGHLPDSYAPPSVALDAQTATTKAGEALASKNAAGASEANANDAKIAAQAARDLALGYRDTASGHATNALASANAAAGTLAGVLASGDASTATTAGCQAITSRSASPLTTPTYDSTGKAVHPTVCHVPGGFGGYEWWMAMTPYAGGAQALENPSILASHDGLTWVVPSGLTNPIVAPLTEPDFNSDPYLVHHSGMLWCFYRSNIASFTPYTERLYYKTSTDGATWSAATLVLASDPTVQRIVSPSVVHHGGVWHMWGVNFLPSPNVVLHWTSATTPTNGAWSAADTCTIAGMPATYEPWHTDVIRDGAEWVMTIHETVGGATSAGGYLHRAISTDGIAWVSDANYLLRGCANNWDGSMYRGCLRPAAVNGGRGYRLWYSALSSALDWRIGHSTVTLRNAGVRRGADLPAACWPLAPYIAGDKVDRADSGTPGVLTSGQTWAIATGTVPVVSKALSSVDGICSIDPGAHGVEIGATVRAIPANGYAHLIACKKPAATTDYVQFGMNGASYLLSTRIGNVGQTPYSSTTVPAIGDRVSLRIVGNDAWCLVNEMVIGRADVTSLAAFNEVGFRFALGTGSAGAYSDFYCVAL